MNGKAAGGLAAISERRCLQMTDLKGEVGETAGKVWDLLNRDGPQTLAQTRKKLGVASEVLNFAIGWLAREDKVDVSREKKDIRIQLI